MNVIEQSAVLSDAAVMEMLNVAQRTAAEMNQPQCVVIVDASGLELATLRMRGAKFLSMGSARAKAQTAASTGAPSANLSEGVRVALASATNGNITGLPGGFPVLIAGVLVGGIGIGSGTGAQDVEVAKAALAAIGADID